MCYTHIICTYVRTSMHGSKRTQQGGKEKVMKIKIKSCTEREKVRDMQLGGTSRMYLLQAGPERPGELNHSC